MLIDGNQVIDFFNTNLYAISSKTVLPTHVAPPLKTAKTAGAVAVAAGWSSPSQDFRTQSHIHPHQICFQIKNFKKYLIPTPHKQILQNNK